MLSCTQKFDASNFSEQEAWEYFEEIVLGSEYKTKSLGYIKKWQKNISYILVGEGVEELHREEMHKISSELEKLTKLKIQKVKNELEANMIIFVGRGEDYVQGYDKRAKNMLKENDGIFWIDWNHEKEIYKASIYVNVLTKTLAQTHLLREEFTQALGLINDSYKYKESIFQTKWTHSQTYTKIDKLLIQILYDKSIRSNMKTEEVKAVFTKLYQKYY